MKTRNRWEAGGLKENQLNKYGRGARKQHFQSIIDDDWSRARSADSKTTERKSSQVLDGREVPTHDKRKKNKEVDIMKKKLGILGILVTFIIFSVPVSVPGADLNPNGFPSGPHFNLNIHGKNANFACPPQEYQLDESGNPTSIPAYGNSIFVPLSTDSNIEVHVESGKKGPKSSPAIAELQVTDWCSGFGDDAEVRFLLPKNDAGYDVYARILAKPTNNPKMTFIDPTLVYAEDEAGYDLMWLGSFFDGGFQTPAGFEFTRSKGKSTAQNITGLFTWSGEVYYISEPESGTYTPEEFCMIDSNSDGLYDGFYPKGIEDCLEGYTLVTLYKVQHENEWVFNIADFVGMFYGLKNEEARLVQLRFYPRQ